VATQKVPLTRIDEAGASEGKVLKYSSGALAWGDDNNSGGGGGGGTAFRHTILGTESISAASLEQYQVHSGLEILSGGTLTIAASGDLVLDAPDDPNKAAGWTDSGLHIATTDTRDSVCIGTHTPLSADDKLSVAGGNLTVAGSISAQGNVYGNAANMANTGKVLQVVEQTWNLDLTPSVTFTPPTTNAASSWVHAFSGTITPSSTTSKILVQATVQVQGADTVNNWSGPQVNANVHRLNSDGTTAFSFISGSGSEPTGGYSIYTRDNHQIATYVSGPITVTRLDVPNSTDALVYNVVVRCSVQWTTCYIYGGAMIMQEIAG
tara:strand:+ start:135 stop:1100 length:966 start_codon:yes stop_codon:yes gene_type:complete